MSVNSTVASTRSLTTGRRTPVRNCSISSANGVLRAEPERALPRKSSRSGRSGCARRRSASGARRGTCRARGAAPASDTARSAARRAHRFRRSGASDAAAAAGLIARRCDARHQASHADRRRPPTRAASGFAGESVPHDSTMASTIAARCSTLGAHSYPGSRHQAGLRGQQDECSDQVRMGGREHRRQAAALEKVSQHRLLGADCVDHGLDVIDLLLQRRRPGDAVGHPAPAPLEQDQPRERREPLEEAAQRTAAPRTARCSTGKTARARCRAAPRPPPGRRSADHRCARNEPPERPRAHLIRGSKSRSTSGIAAFPYDRSQSARPPHLGGRPSRRGWSPPRPLTELATGRRTGALARDLLW